MKDQLFFFTGENTFALAEELRRWRNAFIEKHGEVNWQIITGKEFSWREFIDEVSAAPFLSAKRLVIIDGIPTKITKEDLETLAEAMHPSTIVAFVESSPDKRKAVTKFLLKNATVKTFSKKTPKELTAWIITIGQEQGMSIVPAVAAHLISVVGTDQWHLKQELLKALSYASGKELQNADIDAVCLPSTKHTVWVMSDMIGKGRTEEAVRLAAALHTSGEDAFSLWNIFLWIMKNVSTLWMYQNEHGGNVASLTKEAGIPYPSVQSLLPRVSHYSQEDISHIVEQVVSADRSLKTGEIKATSTEPVELITMLERQILSL